MPRVMVVCTGNVARSPALATLLAYARPDLTVTSAAVGARAQPGRRMARPMRELLTDHGHGYAAAQHRSHLFDPADPPDIAIAVAPVHVRRLHKLAPDVPVIRTTHIPDPAFGGPPAYHRVWPLLVAAAAELAVALPHDPAATQQEDQCT